MTPASSIPPIGSGSFVAFEGVDGAGKSTQIQRLATVLESQGLEVLVVREPGGTEVGEEVRQILLESETPLRAETQLMLFLASRVQLFEERIAPALERGAVVLSDRYHLSSMVYQGFAGELGVERTAKILEAVLEL